MRVRRNIFDVALVFFYLDFEVVADAVGSRLEAADKIFVSLVEYLCLHYLRNAQRI